MPSSTIELHRIRRPPRLNSVTHFTEESSPPVSPGNVVAHNGEDEDAAAIEPPWKRALYRLLEHPTSSPAAFTFHMFSTFIIILSAIITIMETVPTVHSISVRVWFGLETSIVALFTLEYVARCVAWSTTWASLFYWVFSFYGVIDLLSVLPYYLELILQQDTSVYFRFSILRVFRLLRVFRPFRYNHTILLTIEVMYLSVRRSQHALLAIGFFVIMIVTIFSTLLYFAERGTWDEVLGTFINADGDPSQFSSIPSAAWFVLVTISTVGYGEITPRSFLGRLITLPILVCGLLLITLPSFVLGREFSLVWEKMARDSAFDEAHRTPTIPTYTPLHTSQRSDFTRLPSRDLSNLKLAQNQTELSRQIQELSTTVELQRKVLMEVLKKIDPGADLNGLGS